MNKFATSDFQGKDPFGPWPRWRKILWLVITVAIVIWRGPGFIESLRPKGYFLRDFFQEWASARNLFSGKPIYQPLDSLVRLYLQTDPESLKDKYVNVNTHPPTAVLLFSPFGLLDYIQSIMLWNIISLILLAASIMIVFSQLRFSVAYWSILPILTLLLVSNPFRQQMNLGQLNIVILFLVVLTWALDRSKYPCVAGTVLGVATMIKLIPAFLFFYFICTNKWKSFLSGLIVIALGCLITFVLVGREDCFYYLSHVIPESSAMSSGWDNASVAGWWHKLFAPGVINGRTVALADSPSLARAGFLLSALFVILTCFWATWTSCHITEHDSIYGLSIIAMLLVSPVSWDHYFMLLLLPMVLVGLNLPRKPIFRWSFFICSAVLWIGPDWYWYAIIGTRSPYVVAATPFQTLTALSFQCYALICLFILAVLIALRRRDAGSSFECESDNFNLGFHFGLLPF
jgi:hypothetical protein